MMTTDRRSDRLAVELAGTLSAGRKSRHHRSSRLGSSDRPCSRLEILGEANAIGSLFVEDKRLRLTQRECWLCVVGRRVGLPVTSARSAPKLHRSNLYRRACRYCW